MNPRRRMRVLALEVVGLASAFAAVSCAALSGAPKSPADALARAEQTIADARGTCRAVFAAAKASPELAARVPADERERIVKACAALGVKP